MPVADNSNAERTRRLKQRTQAGYLSDAKASGKLYVQQGVGGGVTDASVALDSKLGGVAYTVQKPVASPDGSHPQNSGLYPLKTPCCAN